MYSSADSKAMHVQMADEAYHIGEPPAAQSYLLGDKILDIAVKSGAQAIHPGYGFLSENAGFAKKCDAKGVTFIGPPVGAIEAMGSKSASKEIMTNASVPVVPGYHGEEQSLEHLKKEADRVGYPLMIKAVMGGGGKGMRIAHTPKDLNEAIDSARREAISSFGDDRLLIERYIQRPRHIEFQVFADNFGDCVYLFERDCSVQRRHQKVIEEAPAPGLSEERRSEMGIAAVNAAKAVGYRGAGTVEFIVDEDDGGRFYFMEMNTRLQVEHPVTEMIVKQDLVEWQLKVASGNKLPLAQQDLRIHGHAMEARIYAENPDSDFLPGTGTLKYLSTPEASDNVRVDTGVRQGDEVSVFYDPMIAKLIVWDSDRDAAIRRLHNSLSEYNIAGLNTNIKFMQKVLNHSAFKAGKLDTNFIPQYKEELLPPRTSVPAEQIAAAVLRRLLGEAVAVAGANTPWATLQGRRFNLVSQRTFDFIDNGDEITAVATYEQDGSFTIEVNGETFHAKGFLEGERMRATINGHTSTIKVVSDKDEVHIFAGDDQYSLAMPVPAYDEVQVAKGSLMSPMPGRVIQVRVKEGDSVKQGDTLMIMEAMKMEHKIVATSDGVVKAVNFKEGQLVEENKVLVVVSDGTEE